MFTSREQGDKLTKQYKISYPDMDEIYNRFYFESCSRMQHAVTELYESLHDDKGDIVYDIEKVLDAVYEFKKSIALDTDLIKDIALEIHDTQTKQGQKKDS